jgi:DNA ligase-associated metallophosphoesterase
MPGSTQQADAQRLAELLRLTEATQLVIAGDLFHSKHNNEVDDFAHWRNSHSGLDIHFIMGNHDILPASFYQSLQLIVHDVGYTIGPFYVTHDELFQEGKFTIHGHIHPGVAVRGSQSFPCFAIGHRCMILPAFGRFTGCKRIEPAHYQRIYVVGEEKVLQLK